MPDDDPPPGPLFARPTATPGAASVRPGPTAPPHDHPVPDRLDPAHLRALDLGRLPMAELETLMVELALRHGSRGWPPEAWRVRLAFLRRTEKT